MCLAVPMRVIEVDGLRARAEARGVQRDLSLLLLEPGSVAVGDHVIAHLGQVLTTVSAEDAARSWALFDELDAAHAAGPRPTG